ncbi:serine/threonine-protein kinase [Luteimonas sp. MC1828]|uniref:serine/threonine-protein kinase n=1 Tax=Luteimonas sp. MC1828 TaxID=2799787 RepID=UPI0018F21B60|nr:serine/threonine-protein kinase [Luteimonas sp. MC1828]MBJ7573578.1 serine/threonine protein kinase [Luteimonas sp. MC1828]
MQDRYLQAKALAMEALELAPDARDAWLAQRCADDAGLRAEVDWLIASARTGPDDPLAPGWSQPGPAPLHEGTRVDAAQPGQYRVLRLLGEGGMGVVYLAERDDGDAHQLVALKLLASAGPHGARLAQRMAEERRILATLQHPNIAHLLDGGSTGDGQPFIAMEYVEGERIDRWCQVRALPLRERVALFLKVCSAVEHAHQRLVIHRDLKPANILVTAEGEPKLLDFGIARLVEENAPADPTGTAHRALTLAYASPEHVAGKRLTTATDVWSLGIVLYELLAGTRPHQAMESGHLLPDAIVSGEIRPPSNAPHTGNRDADRDARTISHAVGRIPADIDAIVLKALRHAPEQRYPSVAALSEDLRRFLDSRPVSARRGHALYRLRRFAWRRRWPLVAGMVLLVVGTGFVFERERQLQQVTAERGKAQALAGFMTELFANADPSRSRGEQITVREVLDRGATDLRARTDLPPDVRADLLMAMAEANHGLALDSAAEPLFQEALELKRLTGTPLELSRLQMKLAHVYAQQGRNADAIRIHREAQAGLLQDDPEEFLERVRHRVRELRNEGLASTRPAADMAVDLEEVLATLGEPSDETRALIRSDALTALADARQHTRELDLSLAAHEEAVALLERHSKDAPVVLLTARANQAALMLDVDLERGIRMFEALDADYVRLIGENTLSRAVNLNQLSVGYSRANRDDDAARASGLAVAVARKTTSADNRLYLQLAVGHAIGLRSLGRLDESATLLREVLPGLRSRSAPGVDAVNLAYALAALARVLVDQGQDPAQARDLAVEAEAVLLPHAGDYLVVYDGVIDPLARALTMLGAHGQASAAMARYAALLDAHGEPAKSPWRESLADLRKTLGQ